MGGCVQRGYLSFYIKYSCLLQMESGDWVSEGLSERPFTLVIWAIVYSKILIRAALSNNPLREQTTGRNIPLLQLCTLCLILSYLWQDYCRQCLHLCLMVSFSTQAFRQILYGAASSKGKSLVMIYYCSVWSVITLGHGSKAKVTNGQKFWELLYSNFLANILRNTSSVVPVTEQVLC